MSDLDQDLNEEEVAVEPEELADDPLADTTETDEQLEDEEEEEDDDLLRDDDEEMGTDLQ